MKLTLTLTVRDYSLYLTMYPSFILTMFDMLDTNHYRKVCGVLRGLVMYQQGDSVVLEYESQIPEDYAYQVTGLWYDPSRYISDVESKCRDIVEHLVECARSIRIAVSRPDYIIVLVSTYLSRNTDYYTNVIRWVKALCTRDPSLRNLTPDDIRKIGGSYQLRQLAEVFPQIRNFDLSEDLWTLRRSLLSIKYAGPKVVDAFLIFSGIATCLAPTDIHYMRFVRRLRLFPDTDIRQPQKTYCIRYTCDNCPLATRCLTGLSYRTFGRLSAWIQTVSYVIDRMFCSNGNCLECPLRSRVCVGRSGKDSAQASTKRLS